MPAILLLTPHLSGWASALVTLCSLLGAVLLVVALVPAKARGRILVALLVVLVVLGLAHTASASIMMECGIFGCWFDTLFW